MDEELRLKLAWQSFWKLGAFLEILNSERKITANTYDSLCYYLNRLQPNDKLHLIPLDE